MQLLLELISIPSSSARRGTARLNKALCTYLLGRKGEGQELELFLFMFCLCGRIYLG